MLSDGSIPPTPGTAFSMVVQPAPPLGPTDTDPDSVPTVPCDIPGGSSTDDSFAPAGSTVSGVLTIP